MSYTLDGQTLPNPKKMTRRQIEVATKNTTLDGSTYKDIVRKKEEFRLVYRMLTQAQTSTIISIYEGSQPVEFSVSETNLTISATDVFVEIASRNYNTKGNQYREDIELVLTEV